MLVEYRLLEDTLWTIGLSVSVSFRFMLGVSVEFSLSLTHLDSCLLIN